MPYSDDEDPSLATQVHLPHRTVDHPRCTDLAKVGIIYSCNCPQYNHYHVCKHALGLACAQQDSGVVVPTEFSVQTVGKRSASPGAKSSKRANCLALDY